MNLREQVQSQLEYLDQNVPEGHDRQSVLGQMYDNLFYMEHLWQGDGYPGILVHVLEMGDEWANVLVKVQRADAPIDYYIECIVPVGELKAHPWPGLKWE